MTDTIPRPLYLDKIRPFAGKQIIKVITGQRRTGKSHILRQLIAMLQEQEKHVVYINMEDFAFRKIQQAEDLKNYLDEHLSTERENAILIDEIQEVTSFQTVLRHYYERADIDMYCTGSNASILSGELTTQLTGRVVDFRIYGLTYPEFLRFQSLTDNPESFQLFLRYGSMPFLKNLPLEDETVYTYLKNIYNAVILNDVVRHFQVRNVDFLERLVEFAATHCGSLISAKKISDFLKSQKINIAPNRVLNYLSHLQSAFFLERVKRMQIPGKKIFEIGEKLYFEDIGIRNSIIGYRQADIGQVLENAVYNHLRAHDFSVRIGSLDHGEIDFVAEKRGQTLYLQVCYILADESVREREFGNLKLIPDNHPKMVLSMDEQAGGNIEGIAHRHVRRFLSANPETCLLQ